MNGPEIEKRKLPGAVVCFFSACAVLPVMLPVLELGTRLFSAWYWWGVICGGALMIGAIFCHCRGRKHSLWYLPALLLNAVGDGFSMSALYIHKHLDAAVRTNLPGLLPAACALLLGCLLFLLLSHRKRLAAILAGLAAVAALVFSFGSNDPWWIFACFASLLAGVFLLPMGLLTGHPERSSLRYASFAGFGAFLLITVVVVFLLSEGEVLDGLSGGEGSGAVGRKKKRSGK